MSDNHIKITGLSKKQVKTLDVMWSLDSAEEFNNWFNTLDAHDAREALTLQELIVLELAELSYIKSLDMANNILSKFKK